MPMYLNITAEGFNLQGPLIDATALLLDVLNLQPAGIVDLCRTSDGCYLGMTPGDCGYNLFLGNPTPHEGPGRDRSRRRWRELTEAERTAVRQRAACPLDGSPIPLADFGIE